MIALATDDFSSSHKVGQGAYGSIYKAVFPSGQRVSVKKLSASSDQRLDRVFINEISLVQKLRHPNIIKLLGYFIHKENMLIVHEFMENESLADIIFALRFTNSYTLKREDHNTFGGHNASKL